MGNLTITVDEAVVRQARIRAIQEGTSVSAKVREFLAQYARGGSIDAASDGSPAAARQPDDGLIAQHDPSRANDKRLT